MYTIFVLALLLALANAAAFRVAQHQENQGEFSSLLHSNTLTSICPTELRTVVIDSAVHYRSRQWVQLANPNIGERIKFSIGSCRSVRPISFTSGICAITMQLYRTYIRVTMHDVVLFQYKECKRVPGHTHMRDCLEWIELPGLCQHKILL